MEENKKRKLAYAFAAIFIIGFILLLSFFLFGNKQEKVEYHNVVAWRKLAEIIGQYLKKGSRIYLEGRLQTRSWVDQSGVKKYRTEIIADNMIMLHKFFFICHFIHHFLIGSFLSSHIIIFFKDE